MNISEILNKEINKNDFSKINIHYLLKLYIEEESKYNTTFKDNNFIKEITNLNIENIKITDFNMNAVSIKNRKTEEEITLKLVDNNFEIIYFNNNIIDLNERMFILKNLKVEKDHLNKSQNIGVTCKITVNPSTELGKVAFNSLMHYEEKKSIFVEENRFGITCSKVKNLYIGDLIDELKYKGFINNEIFDLLELEKDLKVNNLKRILLNTFNNEGIRNINNDLFSFIIKQNKNQKYYRKSII